jgi:hypothetical protein
MRHDGFILQKVIPGDVRRSRDIGRVVEELESLPHECAWRIEIAELKSQRSVRANAYYWGVVVEMISNVTGYEPEEVHEYLCGTRFGWRDKRVPKTPRNPSGLESVPVRTTTTNASGRRSVLKVLEFMEFTEFARRLAATKLNLVIPDPEHDLVEHEERAA